MEADIYRYGYKFLDTPHEPNLTLDDLRNLLKGKTWEDVVKMSISTFGTHGVHFTARMGCFLRRNAIAVCAQNMLVAMRFVVPSMVHAWTFSKPLDGSNHCGFVLLPGDFTNGRLGDVKLTDLVIGDESCDN
jgi:hypothetical protein